MSNIYEIVFKVGDSIPGPGHSQRNNWEDGMIRHYMDEGFWWTTAEVNDWIENNNKPTGLNQLPQNRQDELEIFRKRARNVTRPTFTRLWHINIRFEHIPGMPITQEQLDGTQIPTAPLTFELITRMLEQCADIEASINKQLADITANGGMDTNWGFKELKEFGVIQVIANYRQLVKLADAPPDMTQHVMKSTQNWARRNIRVKYEQFLTVQEIVDLQDSDILVNVDRSMPVSNINSVTEAVVRDENNNPSGPGPGTDP